MAVGADFVFSLVFVVGVALVLYAWPLRARVRNRVEALHDGLPDLREVDRAQDQVERDPYLRAFKRLREREERSAEKRLRPMEHRKMVTPQAYACRTSRRQRQVDYFHRSQICHGELTEKWLRDASAMRD
jgi:hypothetical protein